MNNFSKQITPKNDIVFKRIFGTKGNEGILKDFLESILDIEIESLELDLNTELLPEFLEGKKSCVDVRTRLSDGTIFDEFEDIDSKWEIMNQKHNLNNHFKDLEIHIIELKKLRKTRRISGCGSSTTPMRSG